MTVAKLHYEDRLALLLDKAYDAIEEEKLLIAESYRHAVYRVIAEHHSPIIVHELDEALSKIGETT